MSNIEPFIRWAGGKTWFLEQFAATISNIDIRNYYEPFLGGGSVFFSLESYKHAYLTDINSDLINAYIQIRDNPQELILKFQSFENSEQQYYHIRQTEFTSEIDKAAQFIYLNQTSYNGLYRVNKNGNYNVPYGFRENWTYNIERILTANQKLQGVRLKCCDFKEYKYRMQRNDLVFLDPPYTVSHNNNGFIEYNKNLFSLNDQYRLRSFIDYIRNKGAYYILTNAAHPKIEEIFKIDGDRMVELCRNSLIGGKNSKRGKITEYMFTNIHEGVNHDE